MFTLAVENQQLWDYIKMPRGATFGPRVGTDKQYSGSIIRRREVSVSKAGTKKSNSNKSIDTFYPS